MSEDRFKNIELELKDMRKAQVVHHEDMLKVLLKLEHAMTGMLSHDNEIRLLHRSVHDLSNAFASTPSTISSIERRISNIEIHNENQESELKKSFKERDDSHFKLSVMVYIGVGMVAALEFVARFL